MMRAAVYQGNQRLSVEEIPTPSPGPGQVLVQVKYCAICGTDIHAVLYDAAPVGVVLGHEFCGTIAALGEGVTRWAVGDRVVGGGGTVPPGKEGAQLAHPRYDYRTMGFASKPMRAYADYMLMEEWDPVPIPEGVSDEAAALCEPCAIAVRATRRSDLKLGDSVMVLGGGPIGLFCLQTARAAGATSVYLSEPTPVRREAALALGADAVIDPNQGDVVEQALALTGGLGPDVVFDCAGWQRTLDQSLSMVRRNGQVVLVAIAWEDIPVLPIDWMGREIRLQTTFGSVADDWRVALDLMKTGRVDVEPLLSDDSFVPLESINETFEALTKPTTQLQMVIKI